MNKKFTFVAIIAAAFAIGCNPFAKAGDLGIADMKEFIAKPNELPVFRGKCGGPLFKAMKKCRVAFINDRLLVSKQEKASDEPERDFKEFPGITAGQVKSISCSEPNLTRQEFTVEIIYISSAGKWARAGFQFAHGDQVRGFYSELLRWMSKAN